MKTTPTYLGVPASSTSSIIVNEGNLMPKNGSYDMNR